MQLYKKIKHLFSLFLSLSVWYTYSEFQIPLILAFDIFSNPWNVASHKEHQLIVKVENIVSSSRERQTEKVNDRMREKGWRWRGRGCWWDASGRTASTSFFKLNSSTPGVFVYMPGDKALGEMSVVVGEAGNVVSTSSDQRH